MIALHSDCLLLELPDGQTLPCSAEMISIEVSAEIAAALDPELLRHATASVFHYFKNDLTRQTVTLGEFVEALEKVLRHLGLAVCPPPAVENDLSRLARNPAENIELFFFPRLRDELRAQLRRSPRVLRFCGLRGCVKRLAGARRWSRRCEQLQEQIVDYLRGCLRAEAQPDGRALVVA